MAEPRAPVLLLGNVGAGKTSAAYFFSNSGNVEQETIPTGKIRRVGPFVDTPGFNEQRDWQKRVLLKKYVETNPICGIALVFAQNIKSGSRLFNLVHSMFDESLIEHFAVVVTHWSYGDELEKQKKSIQKAFSTVWAGAPPVPVFFINSFLDDMEHEERQFYECQREDFWKWGHSLRTIDINVPVIQPEEQEMAKIEAEVHTKVLEFTEGPLRALIHDTLVEFNEQDIAQRISQTDFKRDIGKFFNEQFFRKLEKEFMFTAPVTTHHVPTKSKGTFGDVTGSTAGLMMLGGGVVLISVLNPIVGGIIVAGGFIAFTISGVHLKNRSDWSREDVIENLTEELWRELRDLVASLLYDELLRTESQLVLYEKLE